MHRTASWIVLTVIAWALIACSSSSDDTDGQPVADSDATADSSDEPTGPTELWVDLNQDGTMELLPPEVKDHRVEHTFSTHEEDPDDGGPDDGPDDQLGPSYLDEQHLVVEIPAVLVPASSEIFTCVYGTWNGPRRGIVNSIFSGDTQTNHHLILHKFDETEPAKFEDGVVFKCSESSHPAGSPMHNWSATAVEAGIGAILEPGQRYFMELHSLNVSLEPVLANAAYRLTHVPVEELNGLAGSFIFGPDTVEVPPGDFYITSTCTWPADATILLVRGHLHERGHWFGVDWTSAAGTERILDIGPWLPEYTKEFQPGHDYKVGDFKVSAGDTFTTHCHWHNDTGKTLTTPQEMCNSFGVAYPLDGTLACSAPSVVIHNKPL